MDIMDFKDPDFKEAATSGQWEPYFEKWLKPQDAPTTEDDGLLLAAYEHSKLLKQRLNWLASILERIDREDLEKSAHVSCIEAVDIARASLERVNSILKNTINL